MFFSNKASIEAMFEASKATLLQMHSFSFCIFVRLVPPEMFSCNVVPRYLSPLQTESRLSNCATIVVVAKRFSCNFYNFYCGQIHTLAKRSMYPPPRLNLLHK